MDGVEDGGESWTSWASVRMWENGFPGGARGVCHSKSYWPSLALFEPIDEPIHEPLTLEGGQNGLF